MIETLTNIITEGSVFDIARVSIAVLLLLYASYTDIKTRLVSDKVWVVMYIAAAVISIIQVLQTDGSFKVAAVAVGVSIAIVGGFSYALYRLYVFHGADHKAFVGIALLLPVVPDLGPLPLNDPSWITAPVLLLQAGSAGAFVSELNKYLATELFGFTVFVNTAMFSGLFFLMNTVHNIRNDNFDINHPLRSTCARRISRDEMTSTYAKIIPRSESDNFFKRGFQFVINGLTGLSTDFYSDYIEWYRDRRLTDPDAELDDLDEIELEEFVEDSEDWFTDNLQEDKEMAESMLDEDELWVTPSIPFIVPITVGLITAVVFGNLAYVILFAL